VRVLLLAAVLTLVAVPTGARAQAGTEDRPRVGSVSFVGRSAISSSVLEDSLVTQASR
jgi:hypothetical protein